MWNHVKGLTEIQINNMSGSYLVHQCSYTISRLVRQNLPLVKSCWLSQINFLSSMCLGRASRKISSMIFPGTVRLTGWLFPWSSFVPLKMSAIFLFFQSPETSRDHHDFSSIFESGCRLQRPIPSRLCNVSHLDP